nr:uncharacterized protein LOC113807859 [Penaeus vannamei]
MSQCSFAGNSVLRSNCKVKGAEGTAGPGAEGVLLSMRMVKALVVTTAVALLAAVSSGGSSSGDQVWVLPDTASNRQHATYLQMLGLAAVEDAVRIRVYAEHLEEAARLPYGYGVSWEVCIGVSVSALSAGAPRIVQFWEISDVDDLARVCPDSREIMPR